MCENTPGGVTAGGAGGMEWTGPAGISRAKQNPGVFGQYRQHKTGYENRQMWYNEADTG